MQSGAARATARAVSLDVLVSPTRAMTAGL
jgi:hypothetical protein